MGGRLEGKVEVVTGAGRGIGRAIALGLAAEGARVVVADYGGALDARQKGSSEPADEVVAEIEALGGEAVSCAEDVSTMEGGQRVVQAAIDNFGRLDGMVCCAGIMVQKYLWEMDEKDWDDVIAVHLKGHFSCAQAAARVMMPKGRADSSSFRADRTQGSPASRAIRQPRRGSWVSLGAARRRSFRTASRPTASYRAPPPGCRTRPWGSTYPSTTRRARPSVAISRAEHTGIRPTSPRS